VDNKLRRDIDDEIYMTLFWL